MRYALLIAKLGTSLRRSKKYSLNSNFLLFQNLRKYFRLDEGDTYPQAPDSDGSACVSSQNE